MTNVFVENITTEVEIEAGYDLFEVVIEDFDQAEIRRYAELAAESAAEALASEEAAADSAAAALSSEQSAAADAAQTASDRIVTTANRNQTTADAAATATDRVAVAADRVVTTANAATSTTQAGIATTKANEASTSASNALSSANTATSQAGIATTKAAQASASQIAAASSASSASNSASSATASASTATTQAGIATTQAGIATTQAGISTTKANEASVSAAAALASENDAETAATTANTQAGIATSQAGIATTQAGIATTQAGISTTQASTATTQAGIATTQAGNSLTSANNAAASAVAAANSASQAAQVGTSTLLTGYTVGPNTPISATDSLLTAFGELQGQINARVSGTLATGQVAFGTAANTIGGDNGLFWDNTNKRLGVGTNVPAAPLSVVNGVVAFTGDVVGSVNERLLLSGNNVGITLDGSGVSGTPITHITMRRGAGTAYSFLVGSGGVNSFQIRNNNNTGTIPVFISSNNNVGIGTTTDAGFRLDVNGTARVQGVLTTTTDAVVNGVNIGRGGGSIDTNTRVGTNALNSNTNGLGNTAIGSASLFTNTTGSSNVAVGRDSGRFIADGVTPITIVNNSIFLGRFTRALADNQTNQIVIGHQSIGLGSNTTVIGNSSTLFGRWFGNLLLGTDTNVASSIFTMDSTTQGFLPPRMTAAQRDLIASPVAGLVIYNTTTNLLNVYNGTSWINL